MALPIPDRVESVRSVDFTRWTDRAKIQILMGLEKGGGGLYVTRKGSKYHGPVSAEDSMFNLPVSPGADPFKFTDPGNYDSAMSVMQGGSLADTSGLQRGASYNGVGISETGDTEAFHWVTGGGPSRVLSKATVDSSASSSEKKVTDQSLPSDPSVGVMATDPEFTGADAVTQAAGSTETQPVSDGEVVDSMTDQSGGSGSSGPGGDIASKIAPVAILGAVAVGAYKVITS